MIVIKAVQDRFTSSNSATQSDPSGTGNSAQPFIRRPTRGIQIKEDTFATLRLVAADGAGNKPLVDAGSRRSVANIGSKRATDIYSNFLLQQVQEERAEKTQILETFGEAYIFLFGQRARVITFSGVLLNTFDFNWEAEWWENYDNYLRGTKCVENDARVYISYDNTLVGGYIVSTSASKNSMDKNHVQFQFQLFVTYYGNFSSVGDPNAFPGATANGVKLQNDTTFDAATLAQFRPQLVQDIPIQSGPLIGNGQAATLFDSLEQNVARVQDAWNRVDQVVNNTINKVSGLFNGDLGTRIPIGFAGDMVFNTDPSEATVGEIVANQKVSYTVFEDNADEYVGVSDHYGTSDWSLKSLHGYGGNTQEQELQYGQAMVDAASQAWAEAGMPVPSVALGPVSSFLVSKGLGLLAAGTTAAWQAASTSLQAGSANPAVLAGGSAVAGGQLPHLAVPAGGF